MAKALEKFVPIRVKESTRTRINIIASRKKKHAYEVVDEMSKSTSNTSTKGGDQEDLIISV